MSSCTSRGEPGARALTQAGVGAGESRLAARLCLERTGRCGFPVSQNASEGCFTECARDLCALGATALRKECPGAGDARAECQPRREISGTDKLSCEGSWTALGFPVMLTGLVQHLRRWCCPWNLALFSKICHEHLMGQCGTIYSRANVLKLRGS